MEVVGYVVLGLVAGLLSGIIGIGGGVIIIPVLVYLFRFSQHQAQGTTLALMVLPIGLLAALQYYKAGFVDVKVAGLICLGFFVGGLFGAKVAVGLSDDLLGRIFGGVLLVLGLRMLMGK